MTEWILKNKKADLQAMSKELGVGMTFCRVLANRGITDAAAAKAFLNPTASKLHEPSLMKNAQQAAQMLWQAVRDNRKIRIIGDYDVDGIMSTFLLYKTLVSLNATVDYRIPDRVLDGYGMNVRMVEEAKESGVEVLLTCDNGIAAREPVALAKSYGMLVIVTDHHDIPTKETPQGTEWDLPEADLIVNPKQPGDAYPQPGICGAMVAYKVIELLLRLVCADDVKNRAFWEEWHEEMKVFAAFATVCDVMELTGENRTVTAQGLKRMKECRNIGVRALLKAQNLTDKTITAYHAGFLLGPCFNAAGRLDTALLGLNLLLCESEEEAERQAAELKELNDTRKQMTVSATQKAVILAKEKMTEQNCSVLVLFLPDCHESLAGIVAGRIREQFYRPTIVLTRGDHCIKGSGRSIEGYSMFEKLSEQKELFLAFGGHPMAAGMSLEECHIEELEKRLNEASNLDEESLTQKLYLDAVLPFAEVTERLMEELELLEPIGNKNAKPVFAQSNVEVYGMRRMGKDGSMMRLSLKDSAGFRLDGLCFNNADGLEEYIRENCGEETVRELYRQNTGIFMTLAFSPQINTYQGKKSPQVVISDYKMTR